MEDFFKNRSTVCALTATDALGRKVRPLADLDKEKQVGLFYFLWIGQHRSAAFDNSVLPLDVQMNDRQSEDIHHYWDKPAFGYYDSTDEWVFRKHLQMFIAAGVDYLVFDTTNGYYYPEVCHKIFPVALKLLQEGWDIPRFIFDTNWNSSGTVEGIYREYYDPSTERGKLYAPLWYRHKDKGGRNGDGKPWIIAKNNNVGELAKQNFSTLPKEIQDFFYLRESAWFCEDKTPYAFPTDIDSPHVIDGMYSVSVAQHTSGAFSDPVFEEDRSLNRGRGWAPCDGKNDQSRVAEGSNYQNEWESALAKGDEVYSVFLSTWNEWVAQKQRYKANGRRSCYFVDQYNDEFSRDIEPVTSGFFDNYYMQTVENIRRFKGVQGEFPKEPAKKVDFETLSGFEKTKAYYGFPDAEKERDCKSANFSLPDYKNASGRNNISSIRVAHDDAYLYFLIEFDKKPNFGEEGRLALTKLCLSFPEFDDNAENAESGQSGRAFDFIVGERADGAQASVRSLIDGSLGEAAWRARDNFLGYRLQRESLPLGSGEFSLAFKAVDNVENAENVPELYTQGVCCPIGRFAYFYAGSDREE